MNNKKERKEVFVARNCDRTSGLTSANLSSNLAYGEIVFLDEKGNLLDTADKVAAADGFRIYQGTHGKNPRVSDIVRIKDIVEMRSAKFAQAVEEKVAVGYNLTDGSVELNVGDKYSMTVEHINHDGWGRGPYLKHHHTVTSSDTQMSVLNSFAEIFSKNYESFDYPPVKVNLISEGSGIAAGVSGVEAIKGSPVITYGAVAGTLPAVGGYIQIAGSTSATGEVEVNGVYKVKDVDATNLNITLDRPFQNETTSGTNAQLVDTADDAGLVIEADLHEVVNPQFEAHRKNSFEVLIAGMGETTLTKTGGYFEQSKGNGRHEDVISFESFNQGTDNPNSYNLEETRLPYLTAEKDHGYSSLYIRAKQTAGINIVEDSSKYNEFIIFFDRGTYTEISNNDAATEFGTNILTGTGIATADGSSVINVLNKAGELSGVLGSGLNTEANEGNNFAADGDYDTGIDL